MNKMKYLIILMGLCLAACGSYTDTCYEVRSVERISNESNLCRVSLSFGPDFYVYCSEAPKPMQKIKIQMVIIEKDKLDK